MSGLRHHARVTSRVDRGARAKHLARRIQGIIGQEVLDARLGAGLSQRVAAGAVGMSHAQWGRIERGEIEQLSIEQAARAAAAVGRRLSVRLYPDGSPVRDAAHLALLDRFQARLPAGTRWRTEIPLPIPGDLRGWDGMAERRANVAAVEAETRLHDLQELERDVLAKQRDGGIEVVILLVNATRRNRRILQAHREALRGHFPLDGHEILDTLRRGELPDQSGILML
jgi:transcriptional regulator with XRE-family HTH domain